jgi:hypothetical protein
VQAGVLLYVEPSWQAQLMQESVAKTKTIFRFEWQDQSEQKKKNGKKKENSSFHGIALFCVYF